MARAILAVMAVIVLVFGTAVPGDAAGGGGGRGGAGHAGGGGGGHWSGGGGGHRSGGGGAHWSGGHGHWGGHHGGWWGPAFFGGLALGATLAYPYSAYAYPYPYYGYPSYYSDPAYPTEFVSRQPAVTYQQQVAVQREVVYPEGKYVLYGDGVTQAWQWVWVPAPPPSK